MSARTQVVGCGLVVVLMTTLVAASAMAQSLAEIGRLEEARRKAITSPAKLYTNADLRGGGLTVAQQAPVAAEADAEPEPGTEAQPDDVADEVGDEEAEEPQTEEYWRDRITSARNRLTRSQLFLEAMQNRVDGLWAEFTARDDRAQREQIELQRQQALDELARVQLEIDEQTQAIADIEEEARRAGVAPAWLR